MSLTTRVVTDSNAMLPPELVERFGLFVIPLVVVIDGVEHRENELDPAEFFDRLRAGSAVSTAAPSPGDLREAYRAAAAAGASEVLSIHIGSNQSATVSSARLAASEVDLPVTIVDTGTASFIEGCCVWRAAEHLVRGASAAEAAEAAQRVASVAGSVFTIGEIDRATAGGRLLVSDGEGRVPIYSSVGPDMSELRKVATIGEATAVMAALVSGQPGPLRVGVGDADAPEAAEQLLDRLAELPNVVETIRYTVGPSVAAHTGAGSFGAVYCPAP